MLQTQYKDHFHVINNEGDREMNKDQDIDISNQTASQHQLMSCKRNNK